MIIPSQSIKIVFATNPVDFCKGHDGLAAEVQNELWFDPHSSIIVVFPSMTEPCVGGFKTAWVGTASLNVPFKVFWLRPPGNFMSSTFCF